MASIHFDITADNSGWVKAIKEIHKGMTETSRVLQKLGEDFDVSSVEKQFVALTRAIEDQDKRLNGLALSFEEAQKQAKNALDSGDLKKYDVWSRKIDAISVDVEEVTNNLKELKAAKQMLNDVAETGFNFGDTQSLFFNTQEAYDNWERLKNKIIEVEETIAQTSRTFTGTDEEYNAKMSELYSTLSNVRDELRECEVNAASAASEFGSASETASNASQAVFSLNNAIEEQKRKIEEDERALKELKKAYDDALEGGDNEKISEARAKYEQLADSVHNAKLELEGMKAEQSQASEVFEKFAEKTDSSSKSLSGFSNILSGLPGKFGELGRGVSNFISKAKGMAQSLETVAGAETAAAGGATAMAGATAAFIALPIIAVLAGVAAGYKAVELWMSRTTEGQDQLNIVTSRYNNVLENLKDMASSVGEKIYNVFSAVEEKAESVLGGLQRMMGIVGSFLGSIGGSILGPFGGVAGGFLGKIIGFTAGKGDKETKALAQRENDVRKQELDLVKERASIQKQKAALRGVMYDSSKSQAERQQALNKSVALTNQLYEKEIKLAKEKAAIANEKDALHKDSTYEQKMENARLSAEVDNLERQRDMELASLTRMGNGFNQKKGGRVTTPFVSNSGEAEKQLLQQQRDAEDMIIKTRQAEIDAMKESDEKVIAQIKLDFQERQLAIERGYKDIARKKVEEARKAWSANPANKGKSFDESSVDTSYTETENAWYEEQLNASYAIMQRAMEDIRNSQAEALEEFIKQYGSYEEKRLAISKEYDRKIADETNSARQAMLLKQKEDALKELEKTNLEDAIDWNGVFSSLEGHTREYLEGLRDQLQGLLSGGNLDIEEMPIIQQKIQEINDELNKQAGIFDFVGSKQIEYNRRLQEEANAKELLAEARNDEIAAEQEFLAVQMKLRDLLMMNGKDFSDVSMSTANPFEAGTKEYKQFEQLMAKMMKGEADLNAARKKTASATDKAKKAEDKAQESLDDAIARHLSNTNEWVNKYLGDLPDLLRSIGLGGLGDKAESGLSGINNVAGAAADFDSQNYVGAALKAVGAVKDFGKALGIGGGNEAEVAETMNRLTERNALLQQSIEDLTQEMKKQSPAEAIKSYQQALKYQQEVNQNALEKAQAQASYNSAHHSFNYYWKGFSEQAVDDFSKLIKRNWNGDIWDLSPEEMKLLRDNVDMWEEIKGTGKGGYGSRVADVLDEYIALAGKTQEITDDFRTAITGVSFDSLYDSFMGTLTDMTSSAEDFANDFEKMMQKAVINSVMSEKIMPKIQAWYERFAKAMESEGMSQEEMLQLLNGYLEESYKKIKIFGKVKEIPNGAEYIEGWNQIVNEALAERDVLMKIFGWSAEDEYKQSAGAKGYQTMSQDTAEVMNGRLTAIQIAVEKIVDNINNGISVSLSGVDSSTMSELRNLAITRNSYLDDVARYTKKMYQEWTTKIDELNTNIKAI